jgi:hypothetical protein
LPNGVDYAFTGNQLSAMAISRNFLECQLQDLILIRSELLAHYKRSLKLRQDIEAAYYTVQNARFYERKDSQLAKILKGEVKDDNGTGGVKDSKGKGPANPGLVI